MTKIASTKITGYTWESTVFALAAGMSVRYVEVPANEVTAFLNAVDSGELDDELVRVATTPTGAVLDAPDRVRKLAAFDRLVRHAVTRSERDPVTGHVMDSAWRPRKRERDEGAGSRHGHGEKSTPAGDSAPAAASAVAATVTGGAVSTARRAWWSSPAVVVGAAVAVVLIASGAFLLTRPDGDPSVGAAAALTPAAAEPIGAGSTAGSAPAAEPPVTANPVETSASEAGSSPSAGSVRPETGSASEAATPTLSSAAAPVPGGLVNPLAGTFALTRTITGNSGNPNIAVGTVDTGTVTFTADCADPGCAVSGPWASMVRRCRSAGPRRSPVRTVPGSRSWMGGPSPCRSVARNPVP